MKIHIHDYGSDDFSDSETIEITTTDNPNLVEIFEMDGKTITVSVEDMCSIFNMLNEKRRNSFKDSV